MEKDKVSLIIPVYNVEKYISNCLNSIINQTYKNIEVIIIDNNSTDSSTEICKNYEKKDNRILIYHEKKQGVSNARNKGIQMATGEYIMFIDSDDTISLNFIKTLVNSKKEDTLLRGFNFNIDKIYDSKEYIYNIFYGKKLGTCCGYLIDRKKCKNIFFDINTGYMEDTEYIIRVINQYKKIIEISNVNYIYDVNPKSATNNIINPKKIVKQYFYSIDKIKQYLVKNNYEFDDNMISSRKIMILKNVLYQTRNIKKLLSDSEFNDYLKKNDKKCFENINKKFTRIFLYTRSFIKHNLLKR